MSIEGPEIKVTTDFLNDKLKNRQITNIELYTEYVPEGYSLLVKNLPLTIISVNCKGKFIYIFSENVYILQNIKFGGNWTLKKDSRCLFGITTSENLELFFRDTKGLSDIKFTMNIREVNNHLQKLGIDILSDPNFSIKYWNTLTQKYSEKDITLFLTDQNIISGCGNYIKCESLYYAGISPFKKIRELTETQLEKLYQGLRIVTRLSYVNRGLGKLPSGEMGGFRNFLQIYSKKTANKNRTQDNKITFWDNKIQK